jgi:SAM-dependent methyltransferase
MTNTSVSFDRAAGFYDQTRGFPPGMADEMAALAMNMLDGRTRALEIGVGTGRIAKPMLARGLHLTGVDLSRGMMNRLRETLGDLPSPMLIEGNIMRLPFADDSFDAVIAVHILHLVSDWQVVLDEVRRVLQGGGVLLLGNNSYRDNAARAIRQQLTDMMSARGLGRSRVGAIEGEIETELIRRGATVEVREIEPVMTYTTPREEIQMIESRVWSSTWHMPDQVLTEIVAELRASALAVFGSLDQQIEVPQTFTWRRFAWV